MPPVLIFFAGSFWWVYAFLFVYCFIFALRNALRDQFNRNFFLQSLGASASLALLALGSVIRGTS